MIVQTLVHLFHQKFQINQDIYVRKSIQALIYIFVLKYLRNMKIIFARFGKNEPKVESEDITLFSKETS